MSCKRNYPDNEEKSISKRQQHNGKQNVGSEDILKGFQIYIFPTGICNLRAKVFHSQIINLGGCVAEKFSEEVTHVIVDEKVTASKVLKVLGLSQFPLHIKFIKTSWLSRCIKESVCLDTCDYELTVPQNCASSVKPLVSEDISSSYLETQSSDTFSEISSHAESSKKIFENQSFVCSIPSSQPSLNQNKYITDKLEVLAELYKASRDHWRAVGYQKAIIALKNYHKPVTSWEEAKSLPGVGDRLADKIYEIIQSGNLRKIEETCSGEKATALSLFTKIWGVGPSMAESLVQQGFRTLDDLLTKAKLTKAQKIGIKYYEEFQDRMLRSEAYEIYCKVNEQIKSIDSQLCCEICGSYRRNRETCGDVDILVTHPDGKSHKGILLKIITALHDAGLLTDDLVHQEENSGQKKYMGVCKLPGENKKHRRIDIIVVPFEEYACALMHFTGSAYFNRSIRLLASRKNMSLSEHSLRTGVVRQGQEKITEGEVLSTPTENSIFEYLDLKYRPPHERDHFAIE